MTKLGWGSSRGRMAVAAVVFLIACDEGGGSDGDGVDASVDASVDAAPVFDGGPVTVTEEIGIDEALPAGPIFGEQASPAVGWNGAGWTVVWGHREVPAASKGHVQVGRVSVDGVVAEGVLDLAGDALREVRPQVACSGSRCLVAWIVETDFATGTRVLRASVIEADGSVVTATPVELGAVQTFRVLPRAGGFLVVRSSLDGVTVTRLDAAGAAEATAASVLVPGKRFIEGGAPDGAVAAACDGVRCLVGGRACPTTAGACDDRVAVIAADGTAIDADGVELSSPFGIAHLTAAGGQFAAFATVGGSGDVRVLRLDADGEAIDLAPIAVAAGSTIEGAFSDGLSHIVLTRALLAGDLAMTRVSTDGGVAAGAEVLPAAPLSPHGGAGAACGDASCLVAVARQGGLAADLDVIATRVAGTMTVDPTGLLLSRAAPAQLPGGVASDGSGYAVIWVQATTSGRDELRVRLVGADGTPEASGSRVVVGDVFLRNRPLIGFDGTGYQVVWLDADDHQVRLQRLDAGGASVGEPLVLGGVAGDAFLPELGLGCTSGQCLVAWADTSISVRRVGSDGVPLDAQAHTLSPGINLMARLSVAHAGEHYGLAWLHFEGNAEQVHFGRIPSSGPLASESQELSADHGVSAPQVLGLGANGFLIQWVQAGQQVNFAQRFRHVVADGSLGALDLEFAVAPPYALQPVAIAAGSEALVAWLSVGEGTSIAFESDAPAELRLARVATSPQLVDATPIVGAEVTLRGDWDLRAASRAAGEVLLVRQDFQREPANLGPRLALRFVRW